MCVLEDNKLLVGMWSRSEVMVARCEIQAVGGVKVSGTAVLHSLLFAGNVHPGAQHLARTAPHHLLVEAAEVDSPPSQDPISVLLHNVKKLIN